jgi:sterol desaturase/sphingolipid hydroxylase (fatty acid hydroxylase superfamily)
MYLPGIITGTYIYFSVKKTVAGDEPKQDALDNVMYNLVLTEILYFVGYFWIIPFQNFSLFNLFAFWIVQDIYFYLVHLLFHRYLFQYHKQHHSSYGPFLSWYCHWSEHLFLNLGSVGIPFIMFPNPSWLFLLTICIEVYTSVNGHTIGSPHHKHHLDTTKRLGSIYIIDKLLGNY